MRCYLRAVEAWTAATSADGIEIAVRSTGTGPGVVIVPGSVSDGAEWMAVAELLAADFTVHVMTRRGTGRSGDSDTYELAREYDDIEAVLAATGSHRLIAHSFGAVCALGAASRSSSLERLALYEPPLTVDEPVVPDDALAAIEAAHARGDVSTVLEIGLTRCVRMPPSVVADLRRSPIWSDLERDGVQWAREIRALHDLTPGVERYTVITTPTLLLVGGSTQEHHRRAIESLHASLPQSSIAELSGADHEGHISDPEQVAGVLLPFLV